MSFAKSGTLIGFGLGVFGLLGVKQVPETVHVYILWIGGFFIALGFVSLLPRMTTLLAVSRLSRGLVPLSFVVQAAEQRNLAPTDKVPDFIAWLLANVRAGTVILYGEERQVRRLQAIPSAHFETYNLVIPPPGLGASARTTGPGGGPLGDMFADGCFYNIQADKSIYRLLLEANSRP